MIVPASTVVKVCWYSYLAYTVFSTVNAVASTARFVSKVGSSVGSSVHWLLQRFTKPT